MNSPKNSTCDIVARSLIESIIKGTFLPGDKLPSLDKIAKQNGTSVISAREAVQNLESLGLLEICHGKGIFVTEGLPIIEDLLEARRTLESYFAKTTAASCSAETLLKLEALIKGMDQDLAAGDTESFSAKDMEFHYTVAKAAGNRILFKTLFNIKNLLRYQLFTVNRRPNIIPRSANRHTEVFNAIKNKDPEKAHAWMWQHMSETIDTWKEHFQYS